MDLSGSTAFYASTAELAGLAQTGIEMSADEVSKRRQLLFWLLKQEKRAPQKSSQPFLLRQEWRVGLADGDVFLFT
ncbi:hypothetical protein [Tateyamaria sp. ANG-S1]|uniref:hypothetical protein n=1 Tax=Tateyamaria sp. ANG-S1 TaxID=1577905 RepID=UPI00057C4368|nr:hypothetical protein [Tateyamaria sp. ANG-S1]KIC48197.1 hypothetical protein RA29_16715 [Tateyamaria sp. ANG-S1]